ncbi:MAG: hypothetical protein NTX79_03890 [Candidatus Micrarchaeota archaeon]|nr:hypothetical protein [Candidatus Micrarchaeota archaeon]
MKFDTREIVAILIVFLLPLGLGQYVAKATLPEYGAAVQIKEALTGTIGSQLECAGTQAECIAKSHALHIAAASSLEKAHAALLGMPAASTQAIIGFLLIFSPLLFALSSVLLYLACREMAYKKTESVFAVLLFALSSTVALAFLPGVYGSGQLAVFLFAASLLPFAMFVHKPDRKAMLAVAALLGFGAGYVNASFALAGIAMAVAFAFAHHKKKEGKNYLAMLGVLALVFAAAGLLSPDKSLLAFSADSLSQAADGMPFLIAGAAVCLGLFFFGRRDSEYFALLALALALSGFSPLAAAILLVFPVAEGATKLMEDVSKGAKLAALFACAFFMVFGLVYGNLSIYPALGAALMLGVLAPLCLHLYSYNARAIFSVMGAGLLLLSVFFALFIQMPPQKQGYPDYTDPALAAALSYLSGSGAQGLATLERADALSFYLPGVPREPAANVEGLLLSGNASGKPGTYILLSLPTLEALSQKGGFEVYYYARNYTNGGATYALFVSQGGRLISRELASGGKFALKDGVVLDSYGRYYAPVPLPRMVMLDSSKPISDKANRMLLLDEGGMPPHLVSIYSGMDSRVALAKEFAGVSVYRVN